MRSEPPQSHEHPLSGVPGPSDAPQAPTGALRAALAATCKRHKLETENHDEGTVRRVALGRDDWHVSNRRVRCARDGCSRVVERHDTTHPWDIAMIAGWRRVPGSSDLICPDDAILAVRDEELAALEVRALVAERMLRNTEKDLYRERQLHGRTGIRTFRAEADLKTARATLARVRRLAARLGVTDPGLQDEILAALGDEPTRGSDG